MCGFAAIIWKAGRIPCDVDALLDRLEANLIHRGPDEGSRHTGRGFAVVHRRLSIVDIAGGHQPMETADERVGLVYNGEVYNHLEIRRELEAKGYVFKTNCDTEVVLNAFVEYGPAAFERLNGMFAVFLWDFRRDSKGEFHLARDHIGTKPLYVYEDGERIIACSELRPLLSVPNIDLSLDPEGVFSYLTFRYVHAPHTLFQRIRRLEAGTRWQVRGARISRWRYWDLPQLECPAYRSMDEAAEMLFDLLKESVNEQQMGEVPIGLLLSGGLDSSAIAYACHLLGVRYETFNIGFPDVNEFEFSRTVADTFGQPHRTIETTPEEITGFFETVVDAMDEPMADPACFPLYVLCREIRHHVTVVLSGEGSDELLGGYPQYAHMLHSSPEPQEKQFQAFLERSWYFPKDEGAMREPVNRSSTWRHYSYFGERGLLGGMLAYDVKTWLPENLLMKADKILMSQSLEGRFPFLSRKIVEFAMHLPDEVKLCDGIGKLVLRRAVQNGVPQSVLTRPKMGFSVPLDAMLERLQPHFQQLLQDLRDSEIALILDFESVRKTMNLHFEARQQNTLWLWNVLVLLQWFKQQRGHHRMSRAAVADAT